MNKRKAVPASVQTDVLTRSRRRCCICFGLHRDDRVKAGQIAHLDPNSSNNSADNLAFLCLTHHDEYDSITSESSGLKLSEVKQYRDQLYEFVERLSSQCEIRLEIDWDYDSYSDEEAARLVRAIRALSGVGEGVQVVDRRRGSVLVTLEMTVEQARAVLAAVREGRLNEHRVVTAKIVRYLDSTGKAGSDVGGFWRQILGWGYGLGRLFGEVSEPHRSPRGETESHSPGRRKEAPGSVERESATNIYVGNLSFNVTEDEIREVFAQYGEVASVNIIQDRETGRSRGFAFVEMPDGEQAKEAIEKVNLTEIDGRAVTVNEARPKRDRPRRGGGGRGRW